MTDGDPRLGDLLGSGLGPDAPPRVVLLGFPSDEGVRRNGGRPGAAAGPEAIRERLRALTPDPEQPAMRAVLERTEDAGDVQVTGEVARDQRTLGEALGGYLRRGVVAIVLGGGHETAYGHYLGHLAADGEAEGEAEGGDGPTRGPEILNWDAHPDVRELPDGRPHSGSPFRQALLHPDRPCRRYCVAGLLPHSTAAEHVRFVREHGGECVWRRKLDAERAARLYESLRGPAMVSFDLDAVDQSRAPGVSAPATGGLPVRLWLHLARRAGRTLAVRSVDVVELNPRFDRDGQTARLAALTVWSVLRGLAEREPPPDVTGEGEPVPPREG